MRDRKFKLMLVAGAVTIQMVLLASFIGEMLLISDLSAPGESTSAIPELAQGTTLLLLSPAATQLLQGFVLLTIAGLIGLGLIHRETALLGSIAAACVLTLGLFQIALSDTAIWVLGMEGLAALTGAVSIVLIGKIGVFRKTPTPSPERFREQDIPVH